ncbi:MAG: hypothetical protein OEQ13_11540 [Acidobacteriota bacterium]|nr:hypothetical protein [Acidobacteriota bacterium]
MIATDKFVYVHMPKTGGTFVTEVLFRLQDLLNTEKLIIRNRRTAFILSELKHGGYRDIPRAHRGKPLLTTIRNPFDLYVSEYEFGWWKRFEYRIYFRLLAGRYKKDFPGFPNLGFEEYLRLWNRAFCRGANKDFDAPGSVGWLTHRFVEFYCPKPDDILRRLNGELVDSGTLKDEMADVAFLRTERLNEDLHRYLLELGYGERDVEFIRGLTKIRPRGSGRGDEQGWSSYYTPELRRKLRSRERFIFEMFPEYDA